MKLVLQPEVAETAAKAIVSKSTLERYSKAEDLHDFYEAKELLKGQLVHYSADSGSVGEKEWHAQFLRCWRPEDKLVYQQVSGIAQIARTTGLEYFQATKSPLVEYDVPPIKLGTFDSDSASSIVGGKQGAVERFRQAEGTPLLLHILCLNHKVDNVGRQASVAMSGKCGRCDRVLLLQLLTNAFAFGQRTKGGFESQLARRAAGQSDEAVS